MACVQCNVTLSSDVLKCSACIQQYNISCSGCQCKFVRQNLSYCSMCSSDELRIFCRSNCFNSVKNTCLKCSPQNCSKCNVVTDVQYSCYKCNEFVICNDCMRWPDICMQCHTKSVEKAIKALPKYYAGKHVSRPLYKT